MSVSTPSKKIYYGWWLVVLLFYTLISTAGNGFYIISVYVPRLIDELGCTTSSKTQKTTSTYKLGLIN
jgi:hypothetical protein